MAYFARKPEAERAQVSCVRNQGDVRVIYVVNLGWHTGIVIDREEYNVALGDLIPQLASEPYVEIGWGDRDFYMASGYSICAGLGALFWSSGSVVHLAGITLSPERYFSDVQIFRVEIDSAGASALADYIRQSVSLDATRSVQYAGEGLYGLHSGFYSAVGSFSISRTCNSWSADALRSAGCRLDEGITRASVLMEELRRGSRADQGS